MTKQLSHPKSSAYNMLVAGRNLSPLKVSVGTNTALSYGFGPSFPSAACTAALASVIATHMQTHKSRSRSVSRSTRQAKRISLQVPALGVSSRSTGNKSLSKEGLDRLLQQMDRIYSSDYEEEAHSGFLPGLGSSLRRPRSVLRSHWVRPPTATCTKQMLARLADSDESYCKAESLRKEIRVNSVKAALLCSNRMRFRSLLKAMQ